ncbi:MAG: hydroxypyruvate isomerase [Cellvibrionaceae bacterium]|jgi:hydroxypyruvate isomerase
MNISVCIDAVYRGKASVEAMKDVYSAGVRAFEFWGWWEKDLEAIRKAKEELGMTAVALCTRFISLVDASKRSDYLQGLKETIVVAQSLGCKTIISQVGDDLGISRAEQQQSLIDGLKACVSLLEQANMQLVFEPLNVLVDHPGYYLTRSDEAFEIAEAVGSSHVKVLFDIYHQQITEGNVIRNIVENIDKIGHFHAAGNPGRHELTMGELNYFEIFRAIKEIGYTGYVGFEYYPTAEPVAGIRPFLL